MAGVECGVMAYGEASGVSRSSMRKPERLHQYRGALEMRAGGKSIKQGTCKAMAENGRHSWPRGVQA